ncbi:MAG: DUF2231 domain-containing protein [Planctomycetota bacterium]
MPTPPPIPQNWDALHPLVVHFPVALLLVAPLFVLLGALTGFRSMMVAALLLLVMGVAGAFVATNTGEAAYNVMEPNYDLETEDEPWEVDPYDVAEEHLAGTELARNIFAGITAFYAVVVVLAYARPALNKPAPRMLLGLLLLAALGYANLVMAEAAHLGGELVHRYGARARLDPLVSDEETEEEADETGSEDAADEETDEAADELPAEDAQDAPAAEQATTE